MSILSAILAVGLVKAVVQILTGMEHSNQVGWQKQFKVFISFLDKTGCQCALTQSCQTVSESTVCNCDSRITNQNDIGILTSDELPISALKYGGSFTSISSINVKLGPFICEGKKGHFPSEAEDIEKKKLNSKIDNLRSVLESFQGNLNNITDKLDDHLRTTAKTTTITTTITTTAKAGSAPVFQKLGIFTPVKNNLIGEITTFYQNYRFSMELKWRSVSNTKLLLVGNVHL